MNSAEKIDNNLISENIFSLKFSYLRQVIFGDNKFISKHTFNIKSFKISFVVDVLHLFIISISSFRLLSPLVLEPVCIEPHSTQV